MRRIQRIGWLTVLLALFCCTQSVAGTFPKASPDGSPRYAAGPENLVAPPGDPDRDPSISSFEQNAEELPFRSLDPLGHGTELTYCAESAGSPNLVVTARSLADNSTTRITLGVILE